MRLVLWLISRSGAKFHHFHGIACQLPRQHHVSPALQHQCHVISTLPCQPIITTSPASSMQVTHHKYQPRQQHVTSLCRVVGSCHLSRYIIQHCHISATLAYSPHHHRQQIPAYSHTIQSVNHFNFDLLSFTFSRITLVI